MAADSVADGDYLGEYSRFFAEFIARVNPDDQLPVKVSVYDVNENELVGEIINVTLQYLNRIYCPPSLQSYIARLVIQAIKSTCKKQPEICGLRQQEKTYAPLKLMQAVTNEVNEICRRYLDNSRLALLPPPSSTPQVSVGAIRNGRRKMEDRHMILHDLNTMFNIQDDTIVDYYAVFDGHGGQDAASYCATHLHQYLVESEHYPTDPERALRDAFLTTDEQFIAKSNTQKLSGGTTAVCALLVNKKLYVAWVGDSMASLVTKGNVEQLVNPHRPAREDESERIRNMGGIVVHCMGVLRVNGFLSISRAIGDVPYKPYISGEPEVCCVPLDGTEDFLIIACDGLWDYIDQQTAALHVYQQVLQDPYDLKHVYQALLHSAKHAGSLDNITVIVVFLTPPIEIASRSSPHLTYQAPNGLLMNNMDPNNPIPSNHDQFDVKPAYIKELIDNDMGRPELDMDLLLKDSMYEVARNGKYRKDDDGLYDFADIGPETDVDAGEDVHDNYSALAASSSLDPTPESEKSPMEPEKHSVVDDDDNRNKNDYSNRDNANVCPVDSIVNDGEDNRAQPSDKDVRGADDEMLRDNDDDDEDDSNARIETAGTHTVLDDDESPPSPRAAKPLQHALIVADNVADSEDSEDEWNYYRADPEKQESAAAVATDKSREGVEEQSAQEKPESVVKGGLEEAESDIKCEGLIVKDTTSSELINIDISDEKKSSESGKNQQILLDLQEETKDQDNMDFQLNPEAAEFVPLSPPSACNRGGLSLRDFAISGSPLKQVQTMDDIPVPSQSEFDKEVCHRPKEIGEDFPHDEHAEPQNNSSQSLDVSEISSTKAEVGDDDSIFQLTHWQADMSSQWNEKTLNDTGSDSEEGGIVTKDNPMAMSLTPGNFKAAFKQDVDLNAVHMLDDSSDGAEQASPPPRSPEPPARIACDGDPPHTPLVENSKNPTDDLCTSTPQPSDDCASVKSSEISVDKDYLSSDNDYPFSRESALYGVAANPLAYAESTDPEDPNADIKMRYLQRLREIPHVHTESSDTKEEEKEACENEVKVFNPFVMNNPFSELEIKSQMNEWTKSEGAAESEGPKNIDLIHCENIDEIKKQGTIIKECFIPEQASLTETVCLRMTAAEQANSPANVDSNTNFIKMDVVKPTHIIENESNQPDWSDYYKTEKASQNSYDNKSDSTTELNSFKSMQKESILFGNTMEITATLTDESVNPEQVETKKDAELVPTNVDEVLNEKIISEDVPLKQDEIEPQKAAETSPKEDIATIDKSKEVRTEVAKVPVFDTAMASPVKAKTATGATTSAKRPTKPTTKATGAPTTKTPAKSPTSPSKALSATARTSTSSQAQSITKKPATNAAARPKQLDGTSKAAVSAIGKTAVTKTALTTKATTTTTATRISTSPRVNSGTTRPKTTTATTSLRATSGVPEKKSMVSGDAKSVSKPATARPLSATSRTTTTSTTAKTTLAKMSSTAKATTSSVTLKSRPASATSAVKTTPTTPRQSSTGVNSSSRPRTAPISSSSTKPRESAGKMMTATGKSPLIDKQSKDTVNKQISRSGASAPKMTGRASAPVGTATGATKTRTSFGKSTGNAAATSPVKKIQAPKTASKTSAAATKRISSNEAKVLQNGIPKEDVTKATVITATSKPEDDVPRKDPSPVNVPTDNQLIAD